MGGLGWPQQEPVVVVKGGVGIRGGSVQRGESDAFDNTQERSRLAVGAGLDLALSRGSLLRPLITVRYLRASRSAQEQSVGLGAHTVRVGLGIDLGRR